MSRDLGRRQRLMVAHIGSETYRPTGEMKGFLKLWGKKILVKASNRKAKESGGKQM